jgi:hypothetical protein
MGMISALNLGHPLKRDVAKVMNYDNKILYLRLPVIQKNL